ncbi:MAG: TIGR00730 family Rossman fold protein [Candidatus Omnitrophota bacterium]
MEKISKKYETGQKDTDSLITKLAQQSSCPETEYLLRQMLTTVAKLGKESHDLADLKMINNTLKELRYAFKIFAPYREIKKVIIFGSARSKQSSAEYKLAEQFARKITDKGYMVVTGGGPGVMEAGNKGAKSAMEFALNIKLPFEQAANPYIDEKDKIINFKYFFTRKLMFVKETDATVLFPGGFGTHDEGFEMLTLIQTGKAQPRPIILMEPKGFSYWSQWKRFITKQLVGKKYINKADLSLFQIANTSNQAVAYIEDFYKVYHSIRYVQGYTVLRLNKDISDKTLKTLNKKFKDILKAGTIKRSLVTDIEHEPKEYLDLPRLIMNFNRHDYSRLIELIHMINKD